MLAAPQRTSAGVTVTNTGRGIPAVLIRQLENLQKVLLAVCTPGQRAVILHNAEMILRASEESVAEESDRQDVWAAYASLLAVARDLWQG